MVLVDLNNTRIVGYDLIDQDHSEFIGFLNQLDVASNADFPAFFQRLYEHTEQHFKRENQLMTEFAFPAESEHRVEHQRVLAEFKRFRFVVDRGMIMFGRLFVRDFLPQWFEIHVATMDYVLATHISTNG